MKSDSKKVATITEYIAHAPKVSRAKLRELRKLMKAMAPKAEEGIGYGIPGYKLEGKPLVYFAGYEHHVGFYGASGTFFDLFKKELKQYEVSKGTVRFPVDRPLPVGLIKKMLKARIQMQATSAKKGRSK
jgi:uncharacterized protein YdhG (YjbR/CyaY superfamily)